MVCWQGNRCPVPDTFHHTWKLLRPSCHDVNMSGSRHEDIVNENHGRADAEISACQQTSTHARMVLLTPTRLSIGRPRSFSWPSEWMAMRVSSRPKLCVSFAERVYC